MSDGTPQAKEAGWYDDFYRTVQASWAPWSPRYTLPHLRSVLTAETRLLELGCGQGHILRHLAEKGLLPEKNIYAIDQSKTAVDFVKERMPEAHLSVGDIYRLEFPSDSFQACLLMETIEHLEEPMPALREVLRVIAPGGLLYISFPNFLSLPWLPFRILAEKLNRPQWIVLQPIDKIYTVFHVIKLARQAGFLFQEGIGSGYGPPYFYRWEKDWMTRGLNWLRLWRFSFHPILVFRKPSAPRGP